MFQHKALGQYQLDVGKMQLNAGVGLSSWGLPVYVGLDYGLLKNICIGGEVTVRNHHDKIQAVRYNHTIIGILANGNYHFNQVWHIPEPWDVYAGINIGVYFWRSSKNYPGTYTSPANAGAQIGGRYYVNEKFAFNAEVGTGNAFSAGKIGISYILK